MKNPKRTLHRQADRDLDEAVCLLASQLVTVLKDEALSLVERAGRAKELMELLKTGRDLVAAKRWMEDLRAACLLNPRLLDLAPGLTEVHKQGAAAARVMKALQPDKRKQSERKRIEGLAKKAGHGPGLPALFQQG